MGKMPVLDEIVEIAAQISCENDTFALSFRQKRPAGAGFEPEGEMIGQKSRHLEIAVIVDKALRDHSCRNKFIRPRTVGGINKGLERIGNALFRQHKYLLIHILQGDYTELFPALQIH